jgi:hypothetical protein
MATPIGNGVQAPLNLVLPLKPSSNLPEKLTAARASLRALIDTFAKQRNVHFARAVVFEAVRRIGIFTCFNGELAQHVLPLCEHFEAVFRALGDAVTDPPPLPLKRNNDEFVRWVAAHSVDGIGFYSAYPTLTVADIRAGSPEVGSSNGRNKQSPLTLLLTLSSPAQFPAMARSLPPLLPKMHRGTDAIGTVHFARFVPLAAAQLVFVSEFDGELSSHARDLARHLGPVIDAIFEHVSDPPPTPVQHDLETFVTWVETHNTVPAALFSAFPALSVQEIRSRASHG